MSKVPNCKDTKIKNMENLGPGVYEKDIGSASRKRASSENGMNESQLNSS